MKYIPFHIIFITSSLQWHREMLKNESILSQKVQFMHCVDQNIYSKLQNHTFTLNGTWIILLWSFCFLQHSSGRKKYLCWRNETYWLQNEVCHPEDIIYKLDMHKQFLYICFKQGQKYITFSSIYAANHDKNLVRISGT